MGHLIFDHNRCSFASDEVRAILRLLQPYHYMLCLGVLPGQALDRIATTLSLERLEQIQEEVVRILKQLNEAGVGHGNLSPLKVLVASAGAYAAHAGPSSAPSVVLMGFGHAYFRKDMKSRHWFRKTRVEIDLWLEHCAQLRASIVSRSSSGAVLD